MRIVHWSLRTELRFADSVETGRPAHGGIVLRPMTRPLCGAQATDALEENLSPAWNRVTCEACLDLRPLYEVHAE